MEKKKIYIQKIKKKRSRLINPNYPTKTLLWNPFYNKEKESMCIYMFTMDLCMFMNTCY